MTGLLFLFGAFLALGLFFIVASILRLPTIGAATVSYTHLTLPTN